VFFYIVYCLQIAWSILRDINARATYDATLPAILAAASAFPIETKATPAKRASFTSSSTSSAGMGDDDVPSYSSFMFTKPSVAGMRPRPNASGPTMTRTGSASSSSSTASREQLKAKQAAATAVNMASRARDSIDDRQLRAELERWKQQWNDELEQDRLLELVVRQRQRAPLAAATASIARSNVTTSNTLTMAGRATVNQSGAPMSPTSTRLVSRTSSGMTTTTSVMIMNNAKKLNELDDNIRKMLTEGGRFKVRAPAKAKAASSLTSSKGTYISLWLTSDGDSLLWRYTGSSIPSPDGAIIITSITSVVPLAQPATGQWFSIKYRSPTASIWNDHGGGTAPLALTLEASSTSLRDSWVSALRSLIGLA
jgi:hypothetical protein